MAENIKQSLNQLLLKIDAAALANDFVLVESLVAQCREVMQDGDDELMLSTENSLAEIMNVVREQRGKEQTVSSSYQAVRPRTGEKGRPKVNIAREELNAFRTAKFSRKKMAEQLGCSTKTVHRRLKKEGMTKKYSEMTEEELDNEVIDLKSSYPNAGSQMIQGYLEARGISLQRKRVRESLQRVDPDGSQERWRTAVHRRQYKVPTPNFLWHLDGHMKLIRWGFTTHGCIDGYSRLVTFLRCSTRNTSSVVLSLFVEACSSYGVPTKARSDHGGENTKVALFLNLVRQTDSFITGQSTHNQRIERMWRDMHMQVTSNYYQQFYKMEDDNNINLDINNNIHRLALQYIFLPIINHQLEEWKRAWNYHKIRTEKHMSPYQLWMTGMLGHMNSAHTAPSELFNETQTSIVEKLENGLSRFGLSLTDIENDSNDNDTTTVDIDENLKEEINNAIEGITTNEQKFLKCVEILELHQNAGHLG